MHELNASLLRFRLPLAVFRLITENLYSMGINLIILTTGRHFMERRNFLRGAALAGTGAALATPAVSGGHGTVLTMVQSWPRGFAGSPKRRGSWRKTETWYWPCQKTRA